jgi:Cu/Ag efflux protein CusF
MDMKGMQGMDEQKCKDMMQNAGEKQPAKSAKATTYKAIAVVKAVDAPNGKVTLNHEAVKSLNWPAMTMSFLVKNKMLLDKLTVGKKVHIEFKKEDSDYVITAVK